jgi:hypothetical protein
MYRRDQALGVTIAHPTRLLDTKSKKVVQKPSGRRDLLRSAVYVSPVPPDGRMVVIGGLDPANHEMRTVEVLHTVTLERAPCRPPMTRRLVSWHLSS